MSELRKWELTVSVHQTLPSFIALIYYDIDVSAVSLILAMSSYMFWGEQPELFQMGLSIGATEGEWPPSSGGVVGPDLLLSWLGLRELKWMCEAARVGLLTVVT